MLRYESMSRRFGRIREIPERDISSVKFRLDVQTSEKIRVPLINRGKLVVRIHRRKRLDIEMNSGDTVEIGIFENLPADALKEMIEECLGVILGRFLARIGVDRYKAHMVEIQMNRQIRCHLMHDFHVHRRGIVHREISAVADLSILI